MNEKNKASLPSMKENDSELEINRLKSEVMAMSLIMSENTEKPTSNPCSHDEDIIFSSQNKENKALSLRIKENDSESTLNQLHSEVINETNKAMSQTMTENTEFCKQC